jgi:hypothetical protein
MLKTYLKPEITRVEMRPVEAALMGCKAALILQAAADQTQSMMCVTPGTIACKWQPGS